MGPCDGDAAVGRRKCGRIVDPVADDDDRTHGGRNQTGLVEGGAARCRVLPCDANGCRNGAASTYSIACGQFHADVRGTQGVDGARCLGIERVGQAVEQARANFGQMTQPPPPQETPLTEIAGPTVDSFIQQYTIAGLTPEDKAFLIEQLPRYVTGSGDARAVDPSFIALMKRTAELRASSATVASVASKAAAANAPKLAAAAIGKKPAPSAPKIVNKPAPDPTREDDFDALWDRNTRAASGAMRAKQFGG